MHGRQNPYPQGSHPPERTGALPYATSHVAPIPTARDVPRRRPAGQTARNLANGCLLCGCNESRRPCSSSSGNGRCKDAPRAQGSGSSTRAALRRGSWSKAAARPKVQERTRYGGRSAVLHLARPRLRNLTHLSGARYHPATPGRSGGIEVPVRGSFPTARSHTAAAGSRPRTFSPGSSEVADVSTHRFGPTLVPASRCVFNHPSRHDSRCRRDSRRR
jgi:hypothetical protein